MDNLMRALGWMIILAIAGVAYGYWDAYHQEKVDVDVTARVMTAWELYFDSYDGFQPVENGTLFIRLSWSELENDRQRVSTIRARGDVLDGDRKITSFDAPCERAGTTWLANIEWTYDGRTSEERVCFIKLDTVLKVTAAGGMVGMNAANAQIANMRVNFSVRARASNKPLRYVSWLNEQFAVVAETLSAPFQRQ